MKIIAGMAGKSTRPKPKVSTPLPPRETSGVIHIEHEDEVETVIDESIPVFHVTEAHDKCARKGNPARHWVFTLQVSHSDPRTYEKRRAWKAPNVDSCHSLRYIVCQLERAPSTGQLHWQGYVQFKTPIRHKMVRTILNADWA